MDVGVLHAGGGMAGRPVGPPGRSARIARVIDLETVRHVARLARLRLQPEEEIRMQEELNGILEHVDRIQSLDLDDVEPTSHVIDVRNVLRDDVPRPSLTREDALENAPEVVDGGFAVPKIG
jgi:aspartyl-tRNA(Asn)/glutamyl-tRNA(Gln) amidotransferase subunit C